MDSLFATRERLLAVLNEELGSDFRELVPAFQAWREQSVLPDVNICGFPCDGGCATCTQSAADLQAFFAPQDHVVIMVSEASASAEGGNSFAEPSDGEGTGAVQVMTYAGDTEDEERALENARSLDAVEEMVRSGEAYDWHGGEEEDACDCRECQMGYAPENWFDDRDDDYDEGYGLDWNESGYFD